MSDGEKRWVRVTSCESIPLREGKAVEIGGRCIAIFNLGESFVAVDNRCAHRGGPLSDGIVSGAMVVCPLHAWAFDLCSGAVTNHPESQACLATFPVRLEDGIVWVEIPAEELETVAQAASCDRDRPVRWVLRKTPSRPDAPSTTPTP
jgi:nitrite reductase (NADH) small subunit